MAFWTGDNTVVPTIPGNGAIWVVPSKGGTPVRVGTRLTTARRSIWSPDGRRLLVIGYASDKLWEASSLDWWTISTNGDVDTRTEIRDALLKAGLENPGYDTYSPSSLGNTTNLPAPACWLAEGNRIIFSALTGDARNLWSTQISADGTIAGAIQRLTVGSGNETNGSCGSNETFVFARKTSVGDLWSFTFDLESGTPTRPPVQLTHGPSTVRESPSISADGQRVAFSQFESSKMSVWVHDLASGKEAKLAPSSFSCELAAASEFTTAFFDCSRSGSLSLCLMFCLLLPTCHTGGLLRRGFSMAGGRDDFDDAKAVSGQCTSGRPSTRTLSALVNALPPARRTLINGNC